MTSWENPVLICPKKILKKMGNRQESKNDEEEYTPFIQLSKFKLSEIY
jgi:hypothetical protein